jgi:hypothetical protein
MATVNSPVSAVVNISVNPLAPSGYQTVTMATGGGYALSTQSFYVGASPASLSAVAPNSAVQGQTLRVGITGVGTHFAASVTTVSFGAGVAVGNVAVNSPASLTVDLTVSPSAVPGSANLTVATGGEIVSLPGSFTIGAASPVVSSVTPASALQGQTLNVVLGGSYTSFPLTGNTATFGTGITVNSVTGTSGAAVSLPGSRGTRAYRSFRFP